MQLVNLKTIIDEPTVREFRQLFYDVTGLFTSLHIPSWNKGELDFVPTGALEPFCRMVQRSPEGKRMCTESDRKATCIAAERKRCFVHQCPLGLTGVAVPVFFQKELLGTLFAGNFLTRDPSVRGFNRVCKLLRNLDVDLEELKRAYFDVPVVATQTMKVAIDMLSLIVNYVVDREQIIHLQEIIWSKQEQLTSALMEKVEFERSLKNQLDEVNKLRRHLTMGTESAQLISEDATTRTRRLVQAAVQYIDDYYSEDLSLKDVADHVNLSPGYLSGVFHRVHGCTFQEYLVRKRMRRACELLQDMRLNVSDVATQVGYSNLSYFSQVFNRTVGMPPRQFRDRIKSTDCT